MTVQILLDFIGSLESRNDPDAMWGRIKREHRPKRPLTEMTVGEVLAWQDSIDRLYMSEAAGEWQFLEDTLRGLYRETGVPLSARFDRPTQIKLATALLKRRGLDDFLVGRISAERFAQNLSKEWASLPAITHDASGRPAQGQSYYAGDGLNRAHAAIDEVLIVLSKVQGEPAPEPRESMSQSRAVQAGGAGVATAIGAGGTAIGGLEGTAQIIALCFVGVAMILFLFLVRDRIQKWAQGVR